MYKGLKDSVNQGETDQSLVHLETILSFHYKMNAFDSLYKDWVW